MRVPRTGTSSMQRVVIDTLPKYFTKEVKVYNLLRDGCDGPPLRVVVYTLTDEYEARATEAMRALHATGMCKREEGKLYGKPFVFPREQLLVTAGKTIEYRFSGGCLQAVPAESVGLTGLFDIANSLAHPGEANYGGALVNVYRESNDRVSLHRDKDVMPSEDTGVVCLSLGGSRILRFEADPKVPGAENYVPRIDIEVCNGEVYVMEGQEFQDRILHACLPPSKKQTFGVRTSMTFRRFLRADKDTKRKHTSAKDETPDAVDEQADAERLPKRAATEAPGK